MSAESETITLKEMAQLINKRELEEKKSPENRFRVILGEKVNALEFSRGNVALGPGTLSLIREEDNHCSGAWSKAK